MVPLLESSVMITKLIQRKVGLVGLWIVYIALGLGAVISEAHADVGAVKKAVGIFLQAELDGSGSAVRKKLITFSPLRQA